MRRVDAGAKRGKAAFALDLGGDRPRAIALIVGNVFERGAAQSASRRQKRDGFKTVGLARAVRPDQRDEIAGRMQARRAVITEMREAETQDTGDGHDADAGALPSPLVGEGGEG